jgi:hypothetical protein
MLYIEIGYTFHVLRISKDVYGRLRKKEYMAFLKLRLDDQM